MSQLRKTLEGRDLWRVSYKNDPADDKYPGRGWCGYLAYSQIRMGGDTPPDPSTDVGAQTMIAALKELVRFAPGSARQNWANIPREEMRYPKEVLLSVIERLGQRKSFLSNRDLPILDWLPAKLLDGTCARLNFSRWSLDPEDEDYNHLMEGPTATGTITNTTELRAILSSGKMMTFRRGHYHVRNSGFSDDFETAWKGPLRS